MARAIAWRIMTPVIIQSNILLPTKPCARSIILFLSFLDEDDEKDDGVCPNSGSRDDEFFFFIELSATSSYTVSLKCQALVSRAKPQIAPSISYLDLSDHGPINLGSYRSLFHTFELIVFRRNRQDILMFSFTSTNLIAID